MSFAFFRTETFKNNMSDVKLGFSAVLNQKRGSVGNTVLATDVQSYPSVRRPVEGLEISERTPAYVTVITKDGKNLLLRNAANADADGESPFYNDFFLLQVAESREEKVSIQETFGQTIIFASGERPRFLVCTGLLIDATNFKWKTEWWSNYDRYLRGTKCIENQARVYLCYNNVLVGGYIIRADTITRADDPAQVPFNFTFLITEYLDLIAENFSIFSAVQQSNVMNETIGSLAWDVKANGEPVNFGDSFWQRQLKLAFGTASPATYLNAIAQDPSILQNPSRLMPNHAINRLKTLAPVSDAVDASPIAEVVGAPVGAPLRKLLVKGTQATGQATGTAIDNKLDPKSLSYIATGRTARKVFGTTLKGTSSMVRY